MNKNIQERYDLLMGYLREQTDERWNVFIMELLQSLRQELCDKVNRGTATKSEEGKLHIIISRIDLLTEELKNYEI